MTTWKKFLEQNVNEKQRIIQSLTRMGAAWQKAGHSPTMADIVTMNRNGSYGYGPLIQWATKENIGMNYPLHYVLELYTKAR